MLGYLAGIADGEGCFTISVGTGKHHVPSFYLGMTDLECCQLFQDYFGGILTFKPSKIDGWKGIWRYEAHGNSLADLLSSLSPYLILKSKQASILEDYQASQRDKRRRLKYNGIPPDIMKYRNELMYMIHALNKRGTK